ncbi:UDP-2,4-diacetamido-2,4,6-trideoxy-beta-L-altropyranose hydrolase [Rheinheimera sp. UJ63]|uniref:UDP-2,4-diacetamido-2,4, 6-trideoxy-beta-L-altropyranose hydrolase n=1 Tax=Rheinheimera sp. UJ63 TaxID=2910157 RepID=UPI001F4018B7|nr:UDP-2,4-diacetamido-2,4,6-trideoxy-beta-L-altropyranose hydrolase [Rheinheimera sp. UJ63]MCF4009088.1 UDP-2,4-diacetamido-2,4,6-trideoxy-beta-L-altropyranose hydrolase [Rheinheimera sp. UJ63]
MKVLFRVDASVTIGSGHVMRCLTLATALRKQHIDCHFLCRETQGNLLALITEQGFETFSLPCEPANELLDSQQSLAKLSFHYQLLVLDHYQLGYTYCKQMRSRCRYIMVIDDLANRTHDCDLLLDQNLLANAANRYRKLVPAHCKTLTGPCYALLREEFYQIYPPRTQHQILVGFGGSDEQNLTSLAIKVIAQLKIPGISADIVIGANNPWREQLMSQLAAYPNFTLHIQCNNMAELMARASLMLGAGGATHWERCITALPGLVVVAADNQKAITEYLAEQGACIFLGMADEITELSLTLQLQHYLTQPNLLAAVSQHAAAIVPKDAGTPLVVSAISKLIN